jgi:hypothetical protein
MTLISGLSTLSGLNKREEGAGKERREREGEKREGQSKEGEKREGHSQTSWSNKSTFSEKKGSILLLMRSACVCVCV